VESSGNVVVDFGKFCTGFLVVMGIGMSTSQRKYILYWWKIRRREQYTNLINCSTAGCPCPLRTHSRRGDGYVNYWGVTDLRDNYQLYHVFPGRARILRHNGSRRAAVFGPDGAMGTIMKQVNCIMHQAAGIHALRDLDHWLYQSGEILFLIQYICGYR
jgi:hypothetical protein